MLSYFTIISNLAVALSLTLALGWPSTKLGRYAASPASQTAVALYIVVVALVYNTVLRGLLLLAGWSWLADTLLHVVVPVLYVGYWLWFTPRRTLRWAQLGAWLVFPAAYLGYSLLRGPVAQWYPYPFLNVSTLGYAQVLRNSGVVLACFLLVGSGLIALNRALPLRYFNKQL
ncbi:Pr6Pr family membrane protein [Hymenobacter sp. RP-2-7]|uniref:Pr6Pr family membrane protein n=1 Tax=Hymenobacter polaris TaxID=2682546 RepID=A0A7Y0ADE3_9BACT|nr:Pr6Pr family membrane protein [Hymenobacter polaris]NML65274.1 Pr6Pr family membrane protein [Hymenobacter polaris]